nr:hypothetical protein [Tanacetum cinerariifolium]
MANLEFCDKHNVVAYLKKPTGSEGFQEIVDFLNDIHIRYALTKNLTIYVSLIKNFWQTATVRTVDNGEQEITATVDGKEFSVTEASVRRHLQLAYADGISVLLTTEIFYQLSLMRQALNKVTKLPHTSKPIPTVADKAVYEEWHDRVERVATTAASLDAEQANGNINRTRSTTMLNVPLPRGIGTGGSPMCQEAMGGSIAQTRSERVPKPSYDSPLLGVHKPRSNKERFEQHELTDLVITRLKLRVKKLEKKKKMVRTPQPLKWRLFKVRVESSADKNLDEEDPSKQGRSMIEEIDQDAGVTLVQIDQGKTYTRRRRAISTRSSGISTASRFFSTAEESVSTAGASMPVSTAGMVQEVNIPSPVAVKDKAVRLQEELDEEERQRMARVHKAAHSFTEEEWENIRARIEADEELARRLQAEEKNKYSEFDQAKMLKPTGSEGFQEIVDFLNGIHIRTVDNGEQEITAIVDGKEFSVTEASVRRHLQLAYTDGISVLLTTEIFDQLSLMGQALNKVTELPHTSEPIPTVADKAVYKEWHDRVERAATTAASLDAKQGNGNINRTRSTTMLNVPLPQGIGAGGSPRCQEAMGGSIAQTRYERESKTAQDLVITRLKLRVKKLEKKKKMARTPQPLKWRLFKVRVESSADKNLDEEDPSKQGRREARSQEYQPKDQLGVLSAAKVLADAARNVQTYTRRRRAISTGSGGISTTSRLFSTSEESVSTAGASMPVSTAGMVQEVNIPSLVVVKDKGKGKMEELEDEQTKRTKLQQEQDRLGYEATVRLQEELDEEERQRMARVHEAAQSFTEEERENIRARIEADEELAQRLQAEEKNKYTGSSHPTITDSAEVGSSKRAAKAKLDYEGSKRQKTNEASGDNLVMLWSLVKERFSSTEPTADKERTLWVKLKRLFEPDTNDVLWKLQRERISIFKRDFDFDVG